MNISKTLWTVLIICAQTIIVICDTPSVYQTGKQYLIDPSEEYNWYQARHACSLQDLQLVILDTQDKNHQLQAILERSLSEFKNLWIGGHKDIAKVNGESVYWHAEKQANKNSTEDQCVYISNNSQTPYIMQTDSCFMKNGFICEESKHTNHQIIKQLGNNSLVSTDWKFSGNYTLAWKDLIRKAVRNTQINIARSLFNIENIIAKFRGIKEKDE